MFLDVSLAVKSVSRRSNINVKKSQRIAVYRSRDVAATVAVSQRIHRWMEVREVSLDSVEHHRWPLVGSAP